jgi:hypothetical protein
MSRKQKQITKILKILKKVLAKYPIRVYYANKIPMRGI